MSYKTLLKEGRSWAQSVFEKIDKKLQKESVRNHDKFPYVSVDGVYDDKSKVGVQWWTNGFWGGMMALMFAQTKNPQYKAVAKESEKMLDGALKKNVAELHHDTGFMWHILSGALYKLTGDEDSKERELLTAMTLASRYNVDGEFIRCWNGEGNEGWSIIDCMMNLSHLYSASEITGDKRFEKIARRHANMAMRDHVREDGSVAHIVVHNVDKPEMLGTMGGQGYQEGSCWSRGQAWGIYGFEISYLHTGEEKYLETAKKMADYFLDGIKKTEYLPLLDFCQPKLPVYYDALAGAIAACGLIEIAKSTGDEKYLDGALKMLKAFDEKWCDYDENTDGILGMCSEAYTWGLKHAKIIYGDYFFVEAVIKLLGNEFNPW